MSELFIYEKCANCGKDRGDHKAVTLSCPVGDKTRVGYCGFSLTDKFMPDTSKPTRVPNFTI